MALNGSKLRFTAVSFFIGIAPHSRHDGADPRLCENSFLIMS
ncbi:hypothetical protein HMPREF0765_0875 [Sphingobacterium spiritivorum ATCC 33300]|uniref:Uncharacterized protein n=1 Tax=Sphingobacterium spiritivorum ATCC 33300 TaxID=525372 RepID=C2FU69_SPHSI|nr:hypothetical protein HMPREF0765_0875 [Sphingobacterium spiritivorum ATCC 33300]